MKALITGATGQDGWYLTRRLLLEGYQVVALAGSDDPALAGYRRDYPAVAIDGGDVADLGMWQELLKRHAPDEIYNLAGLSSVARSWDEPWLTMQTNAVGVAALLEAAVRHAGAGRVAPRIVQASSAELFGHAHEVPQSETTALSPVSPYGVSKTAAHQLCQLYRLRGARASTVILYNHESPRRPPAFVTRKITMAVARIALGGREPLVLGNLDARRDWGWAPDYVDAMVKVQRHPEPDDFVIATGRAHTVEQFVEAAFTYAGVADWREFVRIDAGMGRTADPSLQLGDASKAARLLGWRPTMTFADLVAAMVDADIALQRESGPWVR